MRYVALTAALACALLTGCTDSPRSQDQVRRDTANATSTIASDVKAAALGVKDGLARHTDPAHSSVDINSATQADLEALPGVTPALASSVISHRPYKDPSDLRRRQILPTAVYNENAPRLIAK